MIRVMVMDEEEQVGVNLNNLLQKQGGEFYITAIACHRDAAQRQWEEAASDIIITETALPGWDQDEFLTQIKKMARTTPVIVLSRENDYATIRCMMKAGAWDYLCKATLSAKDFLLTLKEAKQAGKSLHRRALQPLAELLRSQRERYALRRDYKDVIGEAPLKKSLKDGYCIAYFQIDHIASVYASFKDSHKQLEEQLRALIQDKVHPTMDYEYLALDHHAGVLLMKEGAEHVLLSLLEQISEEVKHTLNMILSFTLSSIYRDFNALIEAFNNVYRAHAYHFYTGLGSVVKEWESKAFVTIKDTMNYHNRMWEALKIRDFKELLRIHHEFIADVSNNPIHPRELLEYEVFILNNMEGIERGKGVKTPFPFREIMHSLCDCEDMDELDRLMRQGFERMATWYQEDSSNRYGKDIVEIINYVEANYTQKLTLRMVADVFGMNESYLSRMFKNQTGKNLIYFINEKKMNKARELLKDPDMMVKEAAFAVGYDDQFYFNKLFKRFFGVSPTEYRRRFQREKTAG